MNNAIKHTLLRSILTFFKYTKAHWLLQPFRAGNGVILVLHRAVPASNRQRVKANSRIEISPEFLEELIFFFKNINYEIISLDELYENLLANKKNKPFVCFTFDDGYADAYEIIYPIFRKYRLPFAVYVVTSFPDNTAILWWYMLEDLVLQHEQINFTYKDKEYFFKTSSVREQENAYNTIRDLILTIPQDELEDWLETVFSPYNIVRHDYDNQQMNWQQIRELSNDPLVTVGAHTVRHLNLRQLTSAEVKKEIQSSKQIIEQKTGNPVDHFAYPFGSRVEVGRREFNIAAKSGFKTMTTVREGAVFPAHRHYTECLPRVEITGRHQDLTLVDMRRCGAVSLLRNGLRRVVTE